MCYIVCVCSIRAMAMMLSQKGAGVHTVNVL